MEEKYIICPYCRQSISILLDTGIEGFTNIIDDCDVCCRPIDITYSVEDQEVIALDYRAIEGNEF